jgi:hypothetical protein
VRPYVASGYEEEAPSAPRPMSHADRAPRAKTRAEGPHHSSESPGDLSTALTLLFFDQFYFRKKFQKLELIIYILTFSKLKSVEK